MGLTVPPPGTIRQGRTPAEDALTLEAMRPMEEER